MTFDRRSPAPPERAALVIPESGLMPPKTAAVYLGVSVRCLEDWRRKGYGPAFIHLGRHVRYRRSDVDDWTNRKDLRRAV